MSFDPEDWWRSVDRMRTEAELVWSELEKPAEIDLSFVRRHTESLLQHVLLAESQALIDRRDS